MLILISILSAFVLFLSVESYVYSRRLKQVPVRITVTGTRGKTSVVRLLASVLRADGRRVLAKTTGSEARYIMPDGSEEEIRRHGNISIIEQKKLINRALNNNVDYLLTEIMSINPENHFVETHKLLKPHISILTNFRSDHTEAIENNFNNNSDLFLNDVYPGSRVFIHKSENNQSFSRGVRERKSELFEAEKESAGSPFFYEKSMKHHFTDNLELVSAVSQYLKISDKAIYDGIQSAVMDIGKLEIFKLSFADKNIFYINSFAANDPVSSIKVIEKTLDMLNISDPQIYGLLSLRHDRGGRTKQWLDYLLSEDAVSFRAIFVSGRHSSIFTRRLPSALKLKETNPQEICRIINMSVENNSIVFGLANIKGLAVELLRYWKSTYFIDQL